MNSCWLFFIAITVFIIGVQSAKIYEGLKNTEVDRKIDLGSQLARHKIAVTVSNQGQELASVVHFSLPQEHAKHLSLLTVTDGAKAQLTVNQDDSVTKEGVVFYAIKLGFALSPSASVSLKIKYVLTHMISPFPTQITQSERQLVKYKDNTYYYSPYATEKQTTNVKLASTSIQSNSENSPTVVKGDTITYGPYNNIAPYSHSDLVVHYENNKPFLTVSLFERLLEISHWGNIAVEDWLKIQHDGALLRGSFSRYEYQINPQANGQAAIKSLSQFLPAQAEDVYYRDDIGNVTTSHLSLRQRANKQALHLELLPRFPLFGGWKTEYYMGYNLPSQYNLFTNPEDASQFMLNITFGADFQHGIVIDTHIVHVILPEGVSDIEVHFPFKIDLQSEYKHFTFLDTVGRPVVKVEKYNTINEHSMEYFQVTYKFGRMGMLREPFLLVGAYFAFFLFIMFYVRFELTLSLSKKSDLVDAAKKTELLIKLKDIVQNHQGHFVELDKVLEKHGKSKSTSYEEAKRDVEKELNQCFKLEHKIQDELNKLDESLTTKVKGLENKLRERQKYQQSLHQLKRLKKEKSSTETGKKQYADQVTVFEKLIVALDLEIDSTVADLTDNLD